MNEIDRSVKNDHFTRWIALPIIRLSLSCGDFSMTTTHNLGFPRIGAQRELKFALESYWQGQLDRDGLEAVGAELRRQHWQDQSRLDLVPLGDFSLYDQVLDMSFTLGNLPERVRDFHGEPLDNYFRVARGRS